MNHRLQRCQRSNRISGRRGICHITSDGCHLSDLLIREINRCMSQNRYILHQHLLFQELLNTNIGPKGYQSLFFFQFNDRKLFYSTDIYRCIRSIERSFFFCIKVRSPSENIISTIYRIDCFQKLFFCTGHVIFFVLNHTITLLLF